MIGLVKILVKSGPKKSDRSTKNRVMKSWMTIIVEENASELDIPVISAKELRKMRESNNNSAYLKNIQK